jgi:hypothetical protein
VPASWLCKTLIGGQLLAGGVAFVVLQSQDHGTGDSLFSGRYSGSPKHV